MIKIASYNVALCKEKIQKEMNFYQKKEIIAYFVGGEVTTSSYERMVDSSGKRSQR